MEIGMWRVKRARDKMGRRGIIRLELQSKIGLTLLLLASIRRDRILNGKTDRFSRTEYHG